MSEVKMSKFWKLTVLLSAKDLLFVTVLRVMFGKDQYGSFGIAFWMAVVLFLQVTTGAVIATYEKKRVYGQALLLAALFMLVIGFGICTINS